MIAQVVQVNSRRKFVVTPLFRCKWLKHPARLRTQESYMQTLLRNGSRVPQTQGIKPHVYAWNGLPVVDASVTSS